MNRIAKSLLSATLLIMFLAMLPICALAEDGETTAQRQIELPYNAEYFVNKGDKKPYGHVYPSTYIYDGTSLTSGNIITVEGDKANYEFTFDTSVLGVEASGNKTVCTNDVVNVKDAEQIVPLSGEAAKYIGILVNMAANPDASTTSTTVDLTLKFENTNVNDKVFENETITSMFVDSGKSYSYEKALKPSAMSSSSLAINTQSSGITYFNLIELDLERNINDVASIVFPVASSQYHIIGIVEIPYTSDEIEEIESEVVTQLIPKFVGGGDEDLPKQSLHEIDSVEMGELQSILNVIDSTHEHYEYIKNLFDGYGLYNTQKERKAAYEVLAPYFDYTVEDIYADKENRDEHLSNLQKILDLYDEQENSDKAGLISLMDWTDFEMPEEEKNVFIELESEKYDAISNVIADYPNYEEKEDLKIKIADIFADYDEKTTAQLVPADLEKLTELIAAYDRADEIGISYDAAHRAYIEKLLRDYNNYLTSEDNIHYDLEKYYNKGFVASDGEILPSDWGVSDTFRVDTDLDGTQDTTYNVGMSRDVWKVAQNANGVVKVSNEVNKRHDEPVSVPLLPYDNKTNDGNTFYLSQNIGANDKNVIMLSSTEGSEVTVPGSGRMAASFDLLTVGGNNIGPRNITLKINFTDGTSYDQKIYVAWAGWGSPGVSGMSTSDKFYNKNGVAEKMSSISTPSNYPSDKKVHNGSGWVVRAYSVPVEAGKVIDNVVMSGNGIIFALSERVITNDKYEELLTAQYNKVKDYTDETFDIKESLLLAQYVKEGENRGVDVSKLIDIENADTIIAKVLTAEASFEKTDKTVVTSVIKFSQPVDKDELVKNLVVSKAGAALSNSEYSLTMTDDKTAVIAIDDKFFGGVEYKINISENLPLKCYPSYKIARGYEFSYVSEPYLDFNAECEFEKVSKDKIKVTLKFTQPVMMSELKSNIKLGKSKPVSPNSGYDIKVIDDKTAEIEIIDYSLDEVLVDVTVLENLKLKDYPDYTIPKQYKFSFNSLAFLTATFENGVLTVTNNTKTPYDYVAVITEVSADGSEIYLNKAILDTVTDIMTYDINSELSEDITSVKTASIWDKNQKLMLKVTDIEKTDAKTVETADYMYPTLDFKTNTLKIAGITPSKMENKVITLDVTKKGSTSLIKKQILTNKDGYFEISISLNEKMLPVGTYLTLTLGGDDFNNAINLNEVYFAIQSERESVISSITNPIATDTDIYNVIKTQTNQDALALDSNVYSNIDLEKAAEVIYNNKDLLSVNDTTMSRDTIRALMVLSAFNQDKEDVVSKDGLFLYEDLMGYNNIDKDGVTIYDVYKRSVSAEGKDATVNALLGNDYKTLDKLDADMKLNMFINALEYPNVNGVGYISEVLTAQNAAAVGLDISKYIAIADKSAINTQLESATITSLADITNVINSYLGSGIIIQGGTVGSSGGSSGGGSFSGGSSSVGSFGVQSSYLNALDNQNDKNNNQTHFTDISANHWAIDYITDLDNKGIMNGIGTHVFAPEKELTRAELVKVVCTAAGLELGTKQTPFKDVSSDSWYADYVAAAYNSGIINGITADTFAPNEKVSRQDLCVILYRAMKNKLSANKEFTDSAKIASYAKEAVGCFAGLGIVNGFEDGSFRPEEGCTRAQCAKIIYMFLAQ